VTILESMKVFLKLQFTVEIFKTIVEFKMAVNI